MLLEVKKIVTIILGIITLISCQKYPNLENLKSSYLVQTGYDASINFKDNYGVIDNTYYLPDSIHLISDTTTDSIWYDSDAKSILDEIALNLQKYQYSRIANLESKSGARLVVLVTYISDLEYTHHYDEAWWTKHPDYWNPGDWGWNAWYYPYNFKYTHATGSLIIEMVDSKHDPRQNNSPAIIWSMFAGGVLNSENQEKNLTNVINAIDLAFARSPYLSLE